MQCPKCETETLTSHLVAGVEVDRCPSCQGIWFDDNELEFLLEVRKNELRSLKRGKEDIDLDSKHGQCPRDHTDLLRVCSALDPTLMLDTCVNCHGVWLDGGELSRLVK